MEFEIKNLKENVVGVARSIGYVIIDTKENLIPKIIFSMGEAGIWITDISIKKASLEDVFIQIARGENNVD